MFSSTSDKVYGFIMNLMTRYIIWIIVAVVVAAWFFYPDLMQTFGKIILFWGPAIALICTLILAITRTKIKSKRDEEHGITQYDIIITKWELYLVDLLVYGGSLLILVVPFVIQENGVGVTDLIQTLVYFGLATWIKQIFVNKMLK
jgi:hypothetical protein